tara:strand:+ start:660 stop:1016 length:357 start_codon:yes stop_codon:yes gene_type:complete
MKMNNDGKKGGLLKGKSHKNGGIKAIVTDTNQPVELEGEEVIINKASMKDDTDYTVSGTPKEIASAINSVDDNGVKFEEGAVMTNNETGKTKIMKSGGIVLDIDDSFKKYLWFLKWYE